MKQVFLLTLLVSIVLVGCDPEVQDSAAYVAIPKPALGRLDPAARELIEETQVRLDLAIERSQPGEKLADVFGETGRLYLAYDFPRAATACFENATQEAPSAFRWRYYLAASRQRAGDLKGARADLLLALELEPEDLPALLRLGKIQLDQGEIEPARDHFLEALALDPDSAPALHGLGRIAGFDGKDRLAADYFERVLEIAPEAGSARYGLGIALRELGREDEARHLLATASGTRPQVVDPWVDSLAELLADTVGVRLAAGSRAGVEGDLERAVAQFQQAVKLDPENAQARYQLASALGRQGDHRAALEHLRKSLEIDPDNRDARFNLATALIRLGRSDEALEELTKTLETDPSDLEARLRRAILADAAGQTDLAAADYERLLDENPGSSEVQLAVAARDLASGRSEEALERYRRVEELQPERPEAYLRSARILVAQRRWSEARQELEEGMAVLPGHGQIVDMLARLLATCPECNLQDGLRARRLAETNLKAYPNLDHAETLAMALASSGDFVAAREHQEQLIERAETQGLPAQAIERLRRHLALYSQGQSVRSIGS